MRIFLQGFKTANVGKHFTRLLMPFTNMPRHLRVCGKKSGNFERKYKLVLKGN